MARHLCLNSPVIVCAGWIVFFLLQKHGEPLERTQTLSVSQNMWQSSSQPRSAVASSDVLVSQHEYFKDDTFVKPQEKNKTVALHKETLFWYSSVEQMTLPVCPSSELQIISKN